MGNSADFATLPPRRKRFYHARFWRWFRHPLQVMALRYYNGEPQLRQVELLDGRSCTLRVGTSDRAIVWEVFLKDHYRTECIPNHLECVVDVGAQIGAFSMKMAPRAGRLLAFEPAPENFKILQQNLSGSRHQHVELFQNAVSDRAQTLRLHMDTRNTGAHTVFPSASSPTTTYVDVEAVRLPDILQARNISHIDYLKLDCEGAEYGILQSLEAWGLEHITFIGMEFHPVENAPPETHSSEAIEKLLRKHGFQVQRIPQRRNPSIGMLYAMNGINSA